MNIDKNIWELAEAYVGSTLTPQEEKYLQERRQDADFNAGFQDCVNLLMSLKGSGEQLQLKATLQKVHADMLSESQPAAGKIYALWHNHWKTAAIAAGIAILTSLTTFWVVQHQNKSIASQYSLLRRDLETYKRSQNKLIKDIKQQTTQPAKEARYTGTGFALTNDGYLVTNYHVIQGADSVYIQNKEGEYYKAHVVAFNEVTDVVIMKAEGEKFRFSKHDIPYAIAKDKRKLGTKVFTLGFPQDEIVYNEGYISAKNGYNGDSLQFRLDIQAGPGQSGAPVVDASGNIIGLITGKESESEGTTYAVSSAALHELLSSLPKENNVRINQANKLGRMGREQQIERLEYFTCAIKVYKQ